MNFYNTTNFDSQNDLVGSYTLNRNSAFFQWTNLEQTEFQYVLTARFLDWFQVVNGLSYRAQLGYLRDGQTQYIDYTWTMSLTAEQQQTEEQKTQQEINQGVNDINNFIKNDTYNPDTILENMPNSGEYNSPTDGGFDNIFQRFFNAFTSNDVQNFRFEIPNSNGQFVEIPSNLVTSKLPQPILSIIQTFYWFLFSRFIIKDIAKTAEKAKSGQILDDSSDGNIKTDLL